MGQGSSMVQTNRQAEGSRVDDARKAVEPNAPQGKEEWDWDKATFPDGTDRFRSRMRVPSLGANPSLEIIPRMDTLEKECGFDTRGCVSPGRDARLKIPSYEAFRKDFLD